MLKYLIFSAIIIFMNTCTFASHYPTNLEGNYNCNGVEADNPNDHYKGVVVVKKSGQTYTTNSTFDDGSTYIGTGIYDANKHVLSIVAINPKKSDEIAVSMSNVHEDYSMESKWTYLHKTTIGSSFCTKQQTKA